MFIPVYKQVRLGMYSFDSLVLWTSNVIMHHLLYRLNCHVDKQATVGELFFTGLQIADIAAIEISKHTIISKNHA